MLICTLELARQNLIWLKENELLNVCYWCQGPREQSNVCTCLESVMLSVAIKEFITPCQDSGGKETGQTRIGDQFCGSTGAIRHDCGLLC